MLCRKAPRDLTSAVHHSEVLAVDAGDHHRVDLAENAARSEHFEAAKLPLRKDLGGFHARVALVFVENPRIDFRADLRVHHVDRDGHVIDLVFGDGLDVIRQHEAVGREAKLDVRRLLRHEFEGLEGLGRVRERIARPGDAKHRHPRDGGGDRQRLFHRLLWRQPLAHHAGAGLVGAIVFAVAVVALDVAGRRYGHVHARIMVVGLLAVAGVVFDLLPDFRRQIGLRRTRPAACLAGPAGGAAALLLSGPVQHFVQGLGAFGFVLLLFEFQHRRSSQ